jgi:hypothetical protein
MGILSFLKSLVSGNNNRSPARAPQQKPTVTAAGLLSRPRKYEGSYTASNHTIECDSEALRELWDNFRIGNIELGAAVRVRVEEDPWGYRTIRGKITCPACKQPTSFEFNSQYDGRAVCERCRDTSSVDQSVPSRCEFYIVLGTKTPLFVSGSGFYVYAYPDIKSAGYRDYSGPFHVVSLLIEEISERKEYEA